jgi:hypothetical protein
MCVFVSGGKFCLVLILCAVAACGGGDGAVLPPSAVLANISAQLTGASDPALTGSAQIEVKSDGRLNFAVTVPASIVPDVTALTLNRGRLAGASTILVDLLPDAVPTNATFSGASAVAPAEAAELASEPGEFFVSVPTTADPGGALTSQLDTFTPLEWHTRLLGTEETTVADANARGAASFYVTAPDTIEFVLAMTRPPVTDITAAHIHVGPAGLDGGILVDLEVSGAAVDAATGTMRGTVSLTREALARITGDLHGFYCNAHTAAVPAGVARGQLRTGNVELWAPLTGDQETTVMDADARGGVSLQLESFTGGLVHLAVPSDTQVMSDINGAHVHVGAPGVDGSILINLQTGADYNISNPTGSADGSILFTQETFTRLLADPHAFYCNFHTAVAPAGLVRGQLSDDPITFFAALSGAEETTVVDANASGAANVIFTGVFECSFTITMATPPVGDLANAHVHDGAAGTDGPILVDLLQGSLEVATSGSSVTGRTMLTGRTFTRLLASPELFYTNVHTAAAPAGIARGQMTRITGETPPAISYDTPVVYETGSPIRNNVPASVGGAVVDYAVSPALPAGLSLDAATGVISGTPTQTAAAADYTVTATNAAGSDPFPISITVNVGSPTNLRYTTPVTYVVGTAITPNAPANDGGAIASYTVDPALPAGLNLNANTGVISGTPTAAAGAANHTVTGTNAAASAMATINITVNASLQAPSNLSYTTPVTYTTGTAITANTPTVTGLVTAWTISPALPAGLGFNSTSGVISGTPTSVQSATNYTVTASNSAGNTQATVNITVNLGAPTNLSYSNTPNIGYVTGGLFATMSPTVGGGAVSTYTVSPALPAGISINSTTGVISGTPTTLSSQTTYTVTAQNTAGSTTAQVSITILA